MTIAEIYHHKAQPFAVRMHYQMALVEIVSKVSDINDTGEAFSQFVANRGSTLFSQIWGDAEIAHPNPLDVIVYTARKIMPRQIFPRDIGTIEGLAQQYKPSSTGLPKLNYNYAPKRQVIRATSLRPAA